MTEQEFFDVIDNLRIWRRKNERAPHKPLLILLALAHVHNATDRYLSYSSVSRDLGSLLESFGPKRSSHNPDQPFLRLEEDIWVLTDRYGHPNDTFRSYKVGQLKAQDIQGSFNDRTFDFLSENPDVVCRAAMHILHANFPPSYHEPILERLNFLGALVATDPAPKTIAHSLRDSQFRPSVLREYRKQCAVCESTVRLEDSLLDLEAAHIKWHAAGGPDVVSNGLALCSFHHKAFDRGAIGIESLAGDYRVIVSSEVNGTGPGTRWLLDFKGQEIAKPQHQELAPLADYVDWHLSEVFREPKL